MPRHGPFARLAPRRPPWVSWRRKSSSHEGLDVMKSRFFPRLPPTARTLGLCLCAAGLAAAAACSGGGDQTGADQPKIPSAVDDTIKHESCDESSGRVESLDTNNDGKPDIKRVYNKSTGREVCRIVDLDHDGKPDMFEYYDPSGQLRRREAAYDPTGAITMVEGYQGGKLVSRELDTSGDHRIDTWDTFDPASGQRTKRVRDTNADGKIDQWWTWNGTQLSIAIDKDGDGKPDPEATITSGGPPPGTPDAGAKASTDAGGPPPPPPPPVLMPTDDAGPDAADAGGKS